VCTHRTRSSERPTRSPRYSRSRCRNRWRLLNTSSSFWRRIISRCRSCRRSASERRWSASAVSCASASSCAPLMRSACAILIDAVFSSCRSDNSRSKRARSRSECARTRENSRTYLYGFIHINADNNKKLRGGQSKNALVISSIKSLPMRPYWSARHALF
jgi:hypothetical protein